jgi:hypothetical protein
MIFPILVVLGIITKILDFYYVEVIGLFAILAIVLWFFRVLYKGIVEYEGYKIEVKVRFNVFNYKFVKLNVIADEGCFTIYKKTKANSLLISDDKLPFNIRVALEISNAQKPEITLLL